MKKQKKRKKGYNTGSSLLTEHELITVTVPNTEDDLNPDKPLEQEEQGHRLPVQDIKTS